MEEKGTNIIDDVTARVILFLRVLDSIDSGGILYVGDNIDIAYSEDRLLGLQDFTIDEGVFYGWYDYAVELTQECKTYLQNLLQERPNNINYFYHYAAFMGERCVMQVFDGICIDIDKSIHIPEWLLKECERNKVWVSFSDHIDVSRY